MAKVKTLHRCTSCGATTPQWAGRCPTCGDWNTLEEERSVAATGSGMAPRITGAAPVALNGIDHATARARATGVGELDRVLGGGLVAGSVTLLGGEPGIGKSTLVLQLCAGVASKGARCLVVTGEESGEQVSRRAERLGTRVDNVFLLAETDVESILTAIEQTKPDLVIIDSIQTMSAAGIGSAPGSPTQVRESAQAFTSMAKKSGVAVVLIGHVTKEGTLAGPRVLEHVVDTVLEFEGDRHHELRFIRAVKHRFGATDEVGVLAMHESGLQSVPDASGLFLDDRQAGTPGSIVAPVLHGRRPLLVEVQALTNETKAPMPRRVAQGLDNSRFAVVLAVLANRCGIGTAQHEVFASIVGGAKIDEPASDLALALAVASAYTGKSLPPDLVAIGEVGLGGEIRKVPHLDNRLREAARMGFKAALVPQGTASNQTGLQLIEVATLAQAITTTLPKASPRRPTIDIDESSAGIPDSVPDYFD